YALEGIIRSCGDTLVFLSEQLGLFADYNEACKVAFRLPDSGGVVFVPGQLGLGAPFWTTDVQAEILGLTRAHTKWSIIRAGFASIAFQIKAVITQMERLAGRKVKRLQVDGGLTKLPELMQFLAEVLQAEVATCAEEELSAIGVVRMAGEAEISGDAAHVYQPNTDGSRVLSDYEEWYQCVEKSLQTKQL
uniref:FGGY-family carbohydrate kinase n=1 Tax=Listeria costaricensis TaxID=2026604 RepID=UPI001F095773